MSTSRSLESAASPQRARVAALEAQLAARDQELTALKIELQALQDRYLAEMGPLYAELASLEAAVAEVEIKLGLRSPDFEPDGDEPDIDPPDGCGNRTAASLDLKKIFRDVAKAVHPDLATTDEARFKRHSLMAEANRAYAEQDEDRLRLILRVWEKSPEAVSSHLPEAEATRLARRVAQIERQLAEIDLEFAAVRGSAIARLQHKVADTRAQGWDLFGEMMLHVKREIARARARLASLGRR